VECCDGQRIPLNAEQRAERAGNVPYWGANAIMDHVDQALFNEDLVLLGEDGAPFFDPLRPVAFASRGPIWPNNHVHVLRPRTDGSSRLLAYALNAADYADVIEGSTRDKLTHGKMMSMRLPWPPASERVAITRFLDGETAKIDALVEEQRRLIELLKEKRQAMVSDAVTKGLDPFTPREDSGVEWLGEVPAHWEVTRVANVFNEIADPMTEDLPILSVSIHHGVSDDELDDDELERKVSRSEDRSKYKRVRPNDLVYNMMRAWQGGFGTVLVDGGVSPAYVVARPKGTIETSFVEWLLRTPQCVEEMRTRSVGVTDFRLRLYWDEFKDLRLAVPPLAEQRRIIEAVGSQVEHYRALSEAAEEAIGLLAERRAALISAAVTGKIDVRDHAAAPAQLEPA
jgi:type I restriction enzyme S subunit